MSNQLRLTLIIVTVLTFFFILHSIKKAKMNSDYAVVWIIVVILLVLLALIPQISYVFAEIIGVISPVNGVLLLVIFILIMLSFYAFLKISTLEAKVKSLVQAYAIQNMEDYTIEKNQDKS